MQTPLNTLNDWLTWQRKGAVGKKDYWLGVVQGQVSQLLAEEKRQIEQAYSSGIAHGVSGDDNFVAPEQYFETKYK